VDLLDHVLPVFDVRERHETHVELAPAAALARLLALPAAPDTLTRALFALRGMPARGDSIQTFARRRLGFSELARSSNAVVYGRRARLSIAIAFWAEPDPAGGSRLCTETRVAAHDRRTRLTFRTYWLIVRPFSALIRRRWLRLAART
jgi:hypothetical protein